MSFLLQDKALWALIIIALLQFSSCRSNESTADFEITAFTSLTNAEFETQVDAKTVLLQVDLENALMDGIRIPTEEQCQGGKLCFRFNVKRKNGSNEKLYYKLYFQNASYKYDESNPLCHENFYGSWSDNSIGFKPLPNFTDEIEITDSLFIEGNPRNEQVYFGESPLLELVDPDSVQAQLEKIRNNNNWYTSIIDKAKQENRALEKQMMLDAKWMLNQQRADLFSVNNRHWRNPRMGEYEFMLVVIDETSYKKLPDHQINLSNHDNQGIYVNPFAFFEAGRNTHTNIQSVIAERRLKVYAKYEPGKGIYVPEPNDTLPNRNFYSRNCGDSEYLYKNAQFQQFISEIDEENSARNVPFVENVLSPSFTINYYNKLKRNYWNTPNLKLGSIKNPDCACKNVRLNGNKRKMEFINTGNEQSSNPHKENAGVQGRIGMTYGKWIAKIKFADVLNSSQVWTGITNVFRLISQSPKSGWNQRRLCDHPLAYIPRNVKNVEGSSLYRNGTIGYSRIELELLVASVGWPKALSDASNVDETRVKQADAGIMAVCSNWDMACHGPSDFFTGVKTSFMDGMSFEHYRANDWHKRLISKVPFDFNGASSDHYYYFEIEWHPNKIIWRVGPERDHMSVICVMDDSVTSIPNNQMLPVIAQEWQTTESWNLSPFSQEFIPYPKEDFVGEVLELWVE